MSLDRQVHRSSPKLVVATAAVLLTSVLVTALAHPPQAAVPAQPLDSLRLQYDGWDLRVRELSDRQYEILETREVLFQEFHRGNNELQACVAVAGGNRKVAHPPKICYRGQGWKIVDEVCLDLPLVEQNLGVRELVIAKRGRHQLVWTWYRVGARETTHYVRQQWWGLQSDLRRQRVPSSLFRFSTVLHSASAEERRRGRERLEHFLECVLPQLESGMAERDRPPEGQG